MRSHGVTDESFLPQIVGLFYAKFDPILGPTVAYQVPERLISSSGSDDGGRSLSASRSRSRPRGRNSARALTDGRTASPSPMRGSVLNPNTSLNSSVMLPPLPTPTAHTSLHAGAGTFRAGSPSRERTPTLLDFSPISEYVIPKKSLHGRLVSFRVQGAWDEGGMDGSDDEGHDDEKHEYRVIGLPMVLEGAAGRYKRNQFMWNLCFVFRASASVASFEPVVRKTARILRSAELDTGYLSDPKPHHTPMPAVLEQIFEDLNSYSETSIPLDGVNWIEIRLFPFYPNPAACHDWDVPISLVDLKTLKDPNWDLTALRVVDHINGINHSARIAKLADADSALVRETLRHLLYYQVIMMIDIFQYSNMYTVTPAYSRLVADETVITECGPYVTCQGSNVPNWPTLAALYAKLTPGVTVHQWSEANGIPDRGIDPRRFVSFGVIKGFLKRVHRWPIIVDHTAPLLLGGGLGPGAGLTAGGPPPARRRVGFQSSRTSRGGDSSLSRPGDSAFTLRSQGSTASITQTGSCPGTPPSLRMRSPSRRPVNLPTRGDSTGRSLTSAPDTHPSMSSRRTGTYRSAGGNSGFGGHVGGLVHNTTSRQREGRPYELEDELICLLDGHHHADEIQVLMGMSWTQLESVLGLDELQNGVGRKGIAVVYR